ncbi:dihydrodipicolinate synthase family protein, partial [Candidatus Woesearchaeota archaeon]|nr:dihydrodipicolinate synthase family protein [Candidatus Woesearchaeota archaeon]
MRIIKKEIGKVIVPLADATLPCGLRDTESLEKHCNFLEKEGINTVIVLGRTGGLEYAVGADRHTPHYVNHFFKGNMFVCVGDCSKKSMHGHFSAKDLIRQHIELAEMYEADAIVVPPLFYGPEDYEDCPEDHNMVDYFFDIFGMVAERGIPVLLYNHPAMTGRAIPLDLVEEFAKEDIVIGIKDSSGDMAYFDSLIALREGQGLDFQIYQGSEKLAGWSMRIGADGIVPSLGNVFPRLMADLAENPGNAELQDIVNELGKAIYRGKEDYFDFSAGLRYALGLAGIYAEPENSFVKRLAEAEKKSI